MSPWVPTVLSFHCLPATIPLLPSYLNLRWPIYTTCDYHRKERKWGKGKRKEDVIFPMERMKERKVRIKIVKIVI
jgi:hypothetical protein